MTSVRALITERIARQARRFPDFDLSPIDMRDFDARDASLARAIDHAVASRWLTLQTVLEVNLRKPWIETDPFVRAVLLVGAAQLLLLERVPDHAAINESVNLAKSAGSKRTAGVAGLVNAVLRRVAAMRGEIIVRAVGELGGRDELPLDDGRWRTLNTPVFAEDPFARLAQQTSHPRALLERWRNRFGIEKATRLALHDLVHPPIILAGWNDDAHDSFPESEGDILDPHDERGFFVYRGDRDGLHELLARHPEVRVQDPAAAAAVGSSLGLRPRIIIDVCAGKGTKTKQLAVVHPEADIIASDVDPSRLKVLRNEFKSATKVRVVEPDRLIELVERADLLLLDVPCTNTGVLARRVEARYRCSDQNLCALVDVQRQIVADSIRLLAPQGRLLFTTCSLEAEENEEQAAWITRWHGLHRVHEASRLPRGLPGEPERSYADGGYHALFAR